MKEIIYDGISFLSAHSGYYKHHEWYKGKIVQRIYLHRYIWEKFNGKIPEKCLVHHKDGNKLNNDISNLELSTRGKHIGTHRKELQLHNMGRAVLQYDNKNNLIGEYKNSVHAHSITGIWDTAIRSVCLKKPHYKTAGGFVWRYA